MSNMSNTLTFKEKAILFVTGIVIAAIIAAAIFFGSSIVFKNNSSQSSSSSSVYMALKSLDFSDTKTGDGIVAEPGKTLTVNYTGKIRENGDVFDSSYDRGQPFTFVLGGKQVIEGWEQGLIGMKEGGKRTLQIPASLGYGAQANGPIPANSDLTFEIELIKVDATKPAATQPAAQ